MSAHELGDHCAPLSRHMELSLYFEGVQVIAPVINHDVGSRPSNVVTCIDGISIKNIYSSGDGFARLSNDRLSFRATSISSVVPDLGDTRQGSVSEVFGAANGGNLLLDPTKMVGDLSSANYQHVVRYHYFKVSLVSSHDRYRSNSNISTLSFLFSS